MKRRFVYIELRPAIKSDFADQFDRKKFGVAYFLQNSAGMIEKKVNYFTEDTDMRDFKKLYANKQVYVMSNPNEAILIDNQ